MQEEVLEALKMSKKPFRASGGERSLGHSASSLGISVMLRLYHHFRSNGVWCVMTHGHTLTVNDSISSGLEAARQLHLYFLLGAAASEGSRCTSCRIQDDAEHAEFFACGVEMDGADGAYFIEPGPDVFFHFHNLLLSHNAAEVHH